MLKSIIKFSINNKLIILLFTLGWIGFGIFALMNISIGAVPDITNNQVQVITTSRNLATEEVEKFLTYPVELEMANLPGVKEIRSISKFGLSVVTIVFDDDMGTYLPRQLIAEKIKSAQEKIPAGFGSPFMGPVSTGLGEIYQYVLDVKPGYEDRYTVQDLRTIQDWIVKRQLSGIPGVVEVNTWGGFLKTYEVAVDPLRLKSMNISLSEVFKALESNNSVAGGGYIEKGNESFFIRADGLVGNLTEIENIVVENRDGNPIYVRDLGEVRFGVATRFGAITGNGEGEKVLGQVMMLKGASSKEVIDRVKDRVAEVQLTLPEGIFINPFLERSELIARTTFTIAENLILGSLIVIFVVIILLGNLRSGLIVASVIPLCLLFAISLMYLFEIDANLMSLGAIDFGIIIDGAVIIIEYIAYKFTKSSHLFKGLNAKDSQSLKDEITLVGTDKMMHSAVFGQIIIVIVFIPILSLGGVEGKMFIPMALTFSFALVGAMLLCFTYVPVMSSLFIKPTDPSKRNLSQKLIKWLQNRYRPTIEFALKAKYLILGLAAALLVVAGFTFSRMGGEFVPTLDEGDFVIQPVFKTGMSLDKTVEMTTRMEKIVKRFPEVKQVVTRIGAAEVPTDPMSMEESDVIITLGPKSEWTSAASKDGLADVFKKALESEIPGIEIEFTQPIEMRFNELITGVRADLAIKIFGEDLAILQDKANEIQSKIEGVEGASDIVVEKTEGLPQMMVNYRRDQIAKYGMNIADLNDIISMGFAGKSAGFVFEGERQFDLLIKYKKESRDELEDLRNAQVALPNGEQLPLSSFADISYGKGPAKISRDDTKRRIVVGVNVRGRDLQSVVDEIQDIVLNEIDMPAGYEVQYGGQFENLQSASKRLLVAVPVALVLIFILLYFAFSSIKDALIIFSAIPLASVGGILLLYFRGMPFSISAGVGFIALFGIAVLNGIVLIEHFKALRAESDESLSRIIVRGATERLRPVLLTASAAALGFLPMAISTSAGAEVQRPLATVVIGGLVTATLLTLVVLPVLYAMFSGKKLRIPKIGGATAIALLLIIPSLSQAQKVFTVKDALDLAMENNLLLKSGQLEIEKSNVNIGKAKYFPNTEFFYSHDRANFGENNIALQVVGASQKFLMPSVNRSERIFLESEANLASKNLEVQKRRLSEKVYLSYYNLAYFTALRKEYRFLDSLYSDFQVKAARKYEVGEGNYLEKVTAESKGREVKLRLDQITQSMVLARSSLLRWIQTSLPEDVLLQDLQKLDIASNKVDGHPMLEVQRQRIKSALADKSRVESKKAPELTVSLFNGLSGIDNFKTYPGIEAGLSLPLNRKSYIAQAKASALEINIQEQQLEYLIADLSLLKEELTNEVELHQRALQEYQSRGRTLREELIITATKSFEGGEIDFFRFVQIIEHATEIKINYLDALQKYNKSVIHINHLIN